MARDFLSMVRDFESHSFLRRLIRADTAGCLGVLGCLALLWLPTPLVAQDVELDAEADTSQSTEDRSWIVTDSIEVEDRSPEGSLLERMSSTATRTRTPIEEIPQSIQVLNRTLLEEQDVQGLDDALVNVSGVQPSKSLELVLQQPIVRGFAAEVFLDGLPAFNLTPVVDPTTVINVERLEVLKGPTSTLFGGGIGAPLGGMIHVVSKRPRAAPSGEVGLRFDDDGARTLFFDVNQPTGQRSALRITGEVENSASYLDAVEFESFSFFPTFATRLGPRTELILRGQVSRVENLEYTGLPASITVEQDLGVDPLRFSGTTDAPRTTIDNLLLTARVEHESSSGARWTADARWYDSSFEEYSSFPFFAFFPPDPERPTEFTLIRGQLPTDVRQLVLSPRVGWKSTAGGLSHRLVGGLELDRTRYEAATGFDFTPIGVLDYADPESDLSFGSIPPLTSFFDDTYTTTAVYLQDQVEIGERLQLLVGLRATRLDIEQEGGTSEAYDEVTPRLGLSVDLGAETRAFAGYSEGFRAVLFFAGADGEPPVPETSEHLEVGLKIARDALGLRGTVALYELVRQDVATPDPGNLFAQVQTGEQRSRGVEMDLLWEPSRAWSVLVAYAYADTEVTEDTVIETGDRLVRVPEHSGRVALRWRGGERWRGVGFGVGLTAGSERELTLPNDVATDDYALIDLQASVDLGPTRWTLSVVNLLDEDGFEPFQYLAQSVVIPTRPRTVAGSLRWRF